MMNKQQSSSIHLASYAFLPLFIISLCLVFSSTQAQVKTDASSHQETERSQSTQILSTSSGQDTIVYLVDGKQIKSSEMKTIDPNTIDNIEVVKGAGAKSISGRQDTKGAILITTKEGKQSEKASSPEKGLQERKPSAESIEPNENILVVEGTGYENALIILNGQEVAYDKLKKLEPEQIKGMEVLKGESARKAYGEKGAQGVLKITTR